MLRQQVVIDNLSTTLQNTHVVPGRLLGDGRKGFTSLKLGLSLSTLLLRDAAMQGLQGALAALQVACSSLGSGLQ